MQFYGSRNSDSRHNPRLTMTPRRAASLHCRAQSRRPLSVLALAALVHIYGYDDMAIGMKTTVEISDGLLKEARGLAAAEGSTLRALIEEGLRGVLGRRKRRDKFELKDAGFDGRGLQPEYKEGGWDRLRQAAYEGRGG